MTESASATTRWDTLEQWSSIAFRAGGVLWLIFAGYNGLKVLNVVAPPLMIVNDALLLSGFLAAFVGLISLYPRVAAETPRLALAGASFAAIGAIGLPVDRGAALVRSLTEGVPYGEVTTGLEPLYMVTFFGAVIAFLLFSAASFHARTHSHTTGLLLLVPPVMLLTYLFGSAVISTSGFVLVIWGVIAVGWLALGYRLRDKSTLRNRVGQPQRRPAMTETATSTTRWNTVERRSSTAFLVAGGLWVILAALFAAELFLDMAMSEAQSFFGPAAYGIAFVGLLGLYLALADRTPRLAGAGALFVGIGTVGAAVLAITAGSQLMGLIEARPAWDTTFNLPLLVGVVPGFLTFGIATLQTGAYSRSVSLFLLGPAIMFGAVLVGSGLLGDSFPHWVHVGHSSAEAVIHLSIGYLLRTEGVPTDRAEPAPTEARHG